MVQLHNVMLNLLLDGPIQLVQLGNQAFDQQILLLKKIPEIFSRCYYRLHILFLRNYVVYWYFTWKITKILY